METGEPDEPRQVIEDRRKMRWVGDKRERKTCSVANKFCTKISLKLGKRECLLQ